MAEYQKPSSTREAIWCYIELCGYQLMVALALQPRKKSENVMRQTVVANASRRLKQLGDHHIVPTHKIAQYAAENANNAIVSKFLITIYTKLQKVGAKC